MTKRGIEPPFDDLGAPWYRCWPFGRTIVGIGGEIEWWMVVVVAIA